MMSLLAMERQKRGMVTDSRLHTALSGELLQSVFISHQACAARLRADRGGHRAHGTDGGGTGASLQPGWCRHHFANRCLCFGWRGGREANACDLVHWSKQAILGLALKISGDR